jgi:hypothetical protein
MAEGVITLSYIVERDSHQVVPMSEIFDPDFLAQYEKEIDWARAHGISQRTASRYRALPNGLPFLVFGGFVWIPKRGGREWIASRVQRRHPRRRHQAIATPVTNAA